jgi:hypothetical protein
MQKEITPEIQACREWMLELEQKEFEQGIRKRSHNYFCFWCGGLTHAKVGSERRKAYLCSKCWNHRCAVCAVEHNKLTKGVVGVNGVWFCKEHELIPTIQMLAPHMKPNETAKDTLDRLADERIAELRELRGEDTDTEVQ